MYKCLPWLYLYMYTVTINIGNSCRQSTQLYSLFNWFRLYLFVHLGLLTVMHLPVLAYVQ